jgi:hypothetical protein
MKGIDNNKTNFSLEYRSAIGLSMHGGDNFQHSGIRCEAVEATPILQDTLHLATLTKSICRRPIIKL